MNRTWHVIGIDPAPSKGATVFDGLKPPETLWPADLHGWIEKLRAKGDCLVCWDAPLTGPPRIDMLAPPPSRGPRSRWYSQRIIERFFTCSQRPKDSEGKLRTLPAGISVQPYSGCPHWAISRAVLGLPRLGPYDGESPLTLLAGTDSPPGRGRFVVEVHPALAIWLWLKDPKKSEAVVTDWRYKTKPTEKNQGGPFRVVRGALEERLSAEYAGLESVTPFLAEAKDDDALDAIVAYCLGWLWLNESNSVMLLGSEQTGAILLPRNVSIFEEFSEFQAKQLDEPFYSDGE